jgi:cyclic beta-1,2-glucan synthetase
VTSYDQSKARQQVTLENFYRAMWINPVAGAALLLFSFLHNPMALFITLPFATLWILSPFLLYYLSQEPQRSKTAINDEQRRFLRQTSRQTWGLLQYLRQPAGKLAAAG